MLENITYYMILGRPLIVYLGITTLSMFLITASIPVLINKGMIRVSYSLHPNLARISIALAIIHGSLGILAYI